jgi:hypothetical protein
LVTASGKHGSTNRWREQWQWKYDGAGNLDVRTNNTLVQDFGVNGSLTFELYTPTMAREMPRFLIWRLEGFSTTNASQIKAKQSSPTLTEHPNNLPASYCCPGQQQERGFAHLFHLSTPGSLSVRDATAQCRDETLLMVSKR